MGARSWISPRSCRGAAVAGTGLLDEGGCMMMHTLRPASLPSAHLPLLALIISLMRTGAGADQEAPPPVLCRTPRYATWTREWWLMPTAWRATASVAPSLPLLRLL